MSCSWGERERERDERTLEEESVWIRGRKGWRDIMRQKERERRNGDKG